MDRLQCGTAIPARPSSATAAREASRTARMRVALMAGPGRGSQGVTREEIEARDHLALDELDLLRGPMHGFPCLVGPLEDDAGARLNVVVRGVHAQEGAEVPQSLPGVFDEGLVPHRESV